MGSPAGLWVAGVLPAALCSRRAAASRPVPRKYLPAEGQVQSLGLLIGDGCCVVCASGRAVCRADVAGSALAQQPLFVLGGTS